MPELPWDFLFVMGTIAVTIILPVILLVGVLDIKKRRLKALDGQGESLTTTELQHLVEAAVGRANEELIQRLDRLEHRLLAPEKEKLFEVDMGPGTRTEEPELEAQPRSIGRLRHPVR